MDTAHPRCAFCDKSFANQRNKRRHELNSHLKHSPCPSGYDSGLKSAIRCTDCQENFGTLRLYREHRQDAHNIDMKKYEYQFDTLPEFEDWKDRIEKDVGVNYILQRGPLKGIGVKKQVYFCRRSGVKRKRVETAESSVKRIRHEKSQGSCKIGQFCTSTIEVIQRDTDVLQVTYYASHSDHDLDFPELVHMKLPKSERNRIAGMIMHGIPLEKILDSVRESSGRGRASILERVDLVNITKGFGLFGKSRLHSDDSTSVRLYVEKFKESSELLYFKDQDEMDLNHPAINKKEFILGFMTKNQELYLVNQLKKTSQLNICMDSTHCVCQYKGYQLTTLMCVNDQSQSFPVSFLISSTVSSDIIKVFLDSVKDRVGLIKAHTFMSDDDPIFRNAWHASMYEIPAAFYLNCSWHTDQTFRKNIAKIKATIGEKAVVYQMLRALMDELEEEKFEELCQGFLKYLLDAGYIEFHNYFQQNYLVESRVKLWPKCHRQNVNLTTNNYLESMHKVLKYIYLKGKKAKRLDCTIFALEKMVNDKLYSQMISLMRSRKIAKVKSNFIKCHQEGMDLEIIQQDHGRFMVESASIKDKQYEIQTNTICNNCKERCPDCNVCICMYCCTCEDNKRRNVCKHIHAVAIFCKLAEFDTVEHDKASTSDLQMLQELNFSNKNCAPDESIQNQKSQINNLFSSFPEKLQNCNDPDTLQAIMMHMTQIDGLFTASSKYPLGTSSNSLPVDFDTIKEPANKNTVKQVALYSTQKKRKCEKSLLFKNASKEVRKEIRDSLMLEKGDVGSIPVISDGKVDSEHCYS